MTPLPQQDPLAALWQTAPKSDTSSLLQDLQRLNRRHQRLYWIVFVILSGTALLLIFDAVTEHSMTHGALCVIWILGLVLGIVWHRRARCNRAEAITFDTVRLLRFMIARAKKDLRIARCLNAGAPSGAVVGFIIARLTGFGTSPNAIALSPQVHLIRTGVAVAALITMMVIGLIAARDRRLQVQELREKLRSIQEDM
jgi:FtsH-binding integral membrane protein